MPGTKTLINKTGHDLRVTLIVRKGDTPDSEAGTVQVTLVGGSNLAEDSSQTVSYGNDVDIYLNGIEALLVEDGSAIGSRQAVATRGSDIDNMLNQNDTIEFLYDGNTILLSSTNADTRTFSFSAVAPSRGDHQRGSQVSSPSDLLEQPEI